MTKDKTRQDKTRQDKTRFLTLFLIFCPSLFLFPACNHSTPDDSDTPNMYQEYVVSDTVLKNTGLPIVKIKTDHNQKITSKDIWISASLKLVSDQEDWIIDETSISIRGRGNTTWQQAKKPFAIKFESKTSLCGMPKHKRWVLIANYFDNSFLKNEMAFYLSNQLGMDYTVRGQFVNLVLNGNYVGLYWLGEQIKVDKNRVNIDDDNDFLIEMDQYYDEVWKFKTDYKKLPIQIKNDDTMTSERLEILKSKLNYLESVLYSTDFESNNTFTSLIDIESFAKFYLVNEIMHNGELNWPKSAYFTFDTTNGILKAGPVWDFDWAAYTRTTNLILNKCIYYDALFKNSIFTSKIEELLSSDVLTTDKISIKINELSSQIEKSAELDQKRWGYHTNPVGHEFNSFSEYVNNLEACINSRLCSLKSISW